MFHLKHGDLPVIAVPLLRWTPRKHSGGPIESERLPVAANLYLLTPDKIKVLRNVPWSKRFAVASDRTE